MLFNSYTFLFGFLPLVLVVAFALARLGNTAVIAWLALASFVFYGWWDWHFVPLLAVSIAFNLAAAQGIARSGGRASRAWLAGAVAANLLFLGYFKYAGFFAETVNAMAGTHWRAAAVALPLGISFFTFTQIAYLVDVYRAPVRYRFVPYALFVSY